MKTFIAALATLLAITIGLWINGTLVQRNIRQAESSSKKLAPRENLSELLPEIQQARAEWQHNVALLEFTINHQLLRDVDLYFAALEGASLADSYENYCMEYEKLRQALAHLERINGVSFYTVF